MKLSIIALLGLATVASGFDKLGGPVVDVAQYPTGVDTSTNGQPGGNTDDNTGGNTDDNTGGNTDDNTGGNTDDNTDDTPPANPDSPVNPPTDEQCVEDEFYRGRPTPCDGKRVNHCTVIPKPTGWTYYYYYTYY